MHEMKITFNLFNSKYMFQSQLFQMNQILLYMKIGWFKIFWVLNIHNYDDSTYLTVLGNYWLEIYFIITVYWTCSMIHVLFVQTESIVCKIWGFHGGDYEESTVIHLDSDPEKSQENSTSVTVCKFFSHSAHLVTQ